MTDEETLHALSRFQQRVNGTRIPLQHGLEQDKPVIVATGSDVQFFSGETGSKIQSGRLVLRTPGIFIRNGTYGHEIRITSKAEIISNRRSFRLDSGESIFAEGTSLSKPR